MNPHRAKLTKHEPKADISLIFRGPAAVKGMTDADRWPTWTPTAAGAVKVFSPSHQLAARCQSFRGAIAYRE
jgi:hypothetical protein